MIVYAHPNETIEVRIISDPDLPKNAKEFNYQIRPSKIFIKIVSGDHIEVCQSDLRITQTDMFGNVKSFR